MHENRIYVAGYFGLVAVACFAESGTALSPLISITQELIAIIPMSAEEAVEIGSTSRIVGVGAG